jgi:hypothetical protein
MMATTIARRRRRKYSRGVPVLRRDATPTGRDDAAAAGDAPRTSSDKIVDNIY